jgi:hypothetical protein
MIAYLKSSPDFHYISDTLIKLSTLDPSTRNGIIDSVSIDYAELGSIVGSAIGNIIADGNRVEGVIYSSFIGELGKRLGALISGGKGVSANIKQAESDAANAVSPGTEFANRLGNAAVGSISSLLMTELGNALGLKGFGAELVDTAGSTVLNKAITNVLTNGTTHLFDNFHFNTIGNGFGSKAAFAPGGAGTLVANAIGSFLGAKLGALIYSPQTQAGAALATIGSAVGSWALGTTGVTIGTGAATTTIGSSIASTLGLGHGLFALNVALPGIGALVGFVLGAVIGDLFGGGKPRLPTANAQTVLQIPYASYQLGSISSANGGTTNLVKAMGQTAANTLNGILQQIAGGPAPLLVANGASPTQVYGYTGGQLWLKKGGTSATQINVASADLAVDQGVLWALPQTKVIGGNVFLKRAIQTTQAASVTALMGDLQIASDFSFYQQNTALVNSYITQAYNTLSAAQQTFYASNKALVDQVDMSGVSSLTASQLSVYNANQADIAAIVSALQAQSIANPWIITLQRASELGLANFNASDFFGGLPGFLQSFGLDGKNSFNLADVSVGLSGSTLSLSLPTTSGTGVFSILPQANAAGNSVSITNFLSTMGYAAWTGVTTGGQEVINYGGSTSTLNLNLTRGTYANNVFQVLIDTNDIIIGGNNANYIVGGAGNSWIQGGAGLNYLQGGSGHDVLVGGAGNSQLMAGTNGSILIGGSGGSYVPSWAGTVTTVAGVGITNYGGMYGGAGDDTFIAGTGAVSAWGGNGNDLFLATENGQWNWFDGQGGTNTVSYQRFTHSVTADLTISAGYSWAPTATALPSVYADGTQNLIGSSYNDTLKTGLNGGVLEGGAGSDLLIGGGGVNTVSYEHSSAGVFVDLSTQPGNLVSDPFFTNPNTAWQGLWCSSPTPAATLQTETDMGTRVLRHKTSAAPAAGFQMNTGEWNPANPILVTAGQFYEAGAFLSSLGVNAGSFYIGIDWVTASGSYISTTLTQATPGGSFANGLASAIASGGVFVAPTGAAKASVNVVALASGASVLDIGISQVLMRQVTAGSTFSAADLRFGAAYGGDATGDTFQNIQNVTGSNYSDELKGLMGSTLTGLLGDDTYDFSGGGNSYVGGSGFNTIDYSTATASVSVNLTTGTGSVSGLGADTYQNISRVIGSSLGSTVYGSSKGTTFIATGGTNSFTGLGNDNIELDRGSGTITVSDTNTLSNTITVGSGLTFDNLWIGTQGSNSGYLQVGVRGTSDVVTVNGNFGAYPLQNNDIIKVLNMNGASSVDIGQITYGIGGVAGTTTASETLTGMANRYNMIFAYGGNDTINAIAPGQITTYGAVIVAGATVNGGTMSINLSSGDDQIAYEKGDGHYVLNGLSGGQKSIIFGPTVAATDVIYSVVGNDLYIGLRDPTNTSLAANQVADNIRIVNGGVQIENINTGQIKQNTISYVQAGGTSINISTLNIAWTQTTTSGGGGGGGGGGGPLAPIVLDLNGDGLELSKTATSDIVTRDANGVITRTGWVGPTNGILVTDRAADGKYNTISDISFLADKPGAKTDLEGLAAWDTNGNGLVDTGDANWSKLKVWVDKNQDGRAEAGEVTSLDQQGISAINLSGTPTGFTSADSTDSFATNTTTFTRTDGTTGAAYDVTLARQFIGATSIEDVNGAKWSDVTSSGTFGQMLVDPTTVAGANLAALSYQKLTKLGVYDFSANGKISARASFLWKAYLDPTAIQQRKDQLKAGFQGAEFLASIRTTPGPDHAGANRGTRSTQSRLQVLVMSSSAGGPNLVSLDKSVVTADVGQTGSLKNIGWVGAKDSLLVADTYGDGLIDITTQGNFQSLKPAAKTSLSGLAAYDTNGDGIINAADANFSQLKLWQDANQDGVSTPAELKSLSDSGVQSITLQGAKTSRDTGDLKSNQVLAQATLTLSNGQQSTLYDVALAVSDPTASTTSTASPPAATTSLAAAATLLGATDVTASDLQVTPAPATASAASANVSAARASQDGPNGSIVAANDATADPMSGWWMNGSVAGPALLSDSIAAFQAQGVASPSDPAASSGVTDAASLQRQLLLRQSIAAFQPDPGAAAPLWARSGTTDNIAALVAATQAQNFARQAQAASGG